MVAPQLNGVTNRCVNRSVCLYTNTTDDHLIDTLPDSKTSPSCQPAAGTASSTPLRSAKRSPSRRPALTISTLSRSAETTASRGEQPALRWRHAGAATDHDLV